MLQQNLDLINRIHNGYDDPIGKAFLHSEVEGKVKTVKIPECHIAILRKWRKDHSTDIQHLLDKHGLPVNDMFDVTMPYPEFIAHATEIIKKQKSDSYFSINSFWKSKKSTDTVRHLNGFVLDYDFYKDKRFEHLTPKEMYEQHIKEALPMIPSAVIDSGRGVYVLYLFKHCSKSMLKLYQAIYRELYKSQKHLCMDRKAMNVTQVIRLPGTLNSKCKKIVTILEEHPTDYELTDFAQLLPYTLEETKQYKERNRINYIKDKDYNPTFQKQRKELKLFLRDIKRLILLKNDRKEFTGYREQLHYLVQDRILHAGYSYEYALRISHEINQIMRKPLSNYEIEIRCRPANTNYKQHSIQTIIDKLEITLDDQKKLKYLVESNVKKKREKARKKKHPLLNRTHSELNRLYRRRKVIELLQKGYSKTEVAAALVTDKSQVTRDCQYIAKHKHEFRKILKETIEDIISLFNDDSKLRTLTHEQVKWLAEWVLWREEEVLFENDS